MLSAIANWCENVMYEAYIVYIWLPLNNIKILQPFDEIKT